MKFNKLKYSYSRGGIDNFDSTGTSKIFGVEPANVDDIERPYNKKYVKLFLIQFILLQHGEIAKMQRNQRQNTKRDLVYVQKF